VGAQTTINSLYDAGISV